jgi:hypothetical protein
MTETREIYAWVIDGVPSIFVDDEGLDDAWAVLQGFETTYPGLVTPGPLPMAINLRALYPDHASAKLVVNDLDGSLAALFGVTPSVADDLVTTLEAATDPAPASTWGKDVGTEKIGAAGERRRYSSIPGFNVGLRHLGTNEAFATDGDASPVSDVPVLWDGRRCAVYRVTIVDGVWENLVDAQLVWWGVMRGQGTQKMKTWTFACHGPEALLGKNLGIGNFQDGRKCIPLTTLIDDGLSGPTVLRAKLVVRSLTNLLDTNHEYVEFSDPLATNSNYLDGAGSYDAIVTGINSFLDDQVNSTFNDVHPFNKNGNDITYEVGSGNDGISIKWYRGDSKPDSGDPFTDGALNIRYTAMLYLIAHEKVWRALGYDVRVQNSDRNPVENEDQYGQFTITSDSGYWQGVFFAASPRAMVAYETGEVEGITEDDYSSGGDARRWPPLYPGGAVAFEGEPGQEFQLVDLDELRMSGSKSRPVMADPDDETSARTITGVGLANRQGLMVFEGPYRRRGDQDQVDPVAGYAFAQSREQELGRTTQVARVCWRGDLVERDAEDLPRFVIYEWLDPRLFGFDFEPLDGGTWAAFRDPPPDAESIVARPLIALEYSDEGDRAATVLRRLMLTTGTAGEWYTDPGLVTPLFGLGGQAGFLDAGDNDDGAEPFAGDSEAAALGLGIPASMVAAPSVFEAAFEAAQDLGRCKVVSTTALPSTELIRRLFEPAGVAMAYPGGVYAPIDAWTMPTPDEAVRLITPEDYALKPGRAPKDVIPAQRMRQYAPMDSVRVQGTREPIGGDYHRTIERTTSDLGAAYRQGGEVAQTARGDYLITNTHPVLGSSWVSAIASRWPDGFRFWAAGHTLCSFTLLSSVGLDIWPGDGVLVSDPWLLDTLGMYGVTAAAGRVVSRVPNPSKETVKLEVLVGADTDYRLWAPAADVYRYDEQELGPDFRLLCRDDYLGDRGGDSFDVDGFAEPSWSVAGGLATIEVFQFDGETWTGGIFGEVASVAGLVGASKITLTGALTGATWFSDRASRVVLREYSAQAVGSWVLDVYGPIGDENGELSPGVKVAKWMGV